MFLVDTDVLSAPRRRERNPKAVQWVKTQRASDMYTSVVTAGGIERGVTQQRQRNQQFADELASWLDRLIPGTRTARCQWTPQPRAVGDNCLRT
jgi:predicted nucleic acid-binding protein